MGLPPDSHSAFMTRMASSRRAAGFVRRSPYGSNCFASPLPMHHVARPLAMCEIVTASCAKTAGLRRNGSTTAICSSISSVSTAAALSSSNEPYQIAECALDETAVVFGRRGVVGLQADRVRARQLVGEREEVPPLGLGAGHGREGRVDRREAATQHPELHAAPSFAIPPVPAPGGSVTSREAV